VDRTEILIKIGNVEIPTGIYVSEGEIRDSTILQFHLENALRESLSDITDQFVSRVVKKEGNRTTVRFD
jgi:hypothetical protein